MRIVALTGNQLRHRFYTDYLSRFHDLMAIFAEDRFDQDAYGSEYSLIRQHFELRDRTEDTFFGSCAWPSSARLVPVPRNQMSSPEVEQAIRVLKPEGIAVLGCGIIKKNIIDLCPHIVNAHQGLSPYYRGSGTNFWPLYDGRPEYVGVTVHYIDSGVDTGNIICHGRPEIEPDDAQHDIGCKTIKVSAELVARVFAILKKNPLPGVQQWNEGTNYTRRDFTAEAVKRVRDLFQQGLIRTYLERKRAGATWVRVITLDT